MQTFLPYQDFEESAKVLDWEGSGNRLGNQRNEGFIILRANLQGPKCHYDAEARIYHHFTDLEEVDYSSKIVMRDTPWYNHTATRMWRGSDVVLFVYVMTVCKQWTDRGNYDTVADIVVSLVDKHGASKLKNRHPEWLGDPDFHLSHQSNLIRKDPGYYGKIFKGVPDNLPYIWPKGALE